MPPLPIVAAGSSLVRIVVCLVSLLACQQISRLNAQEPIPRPLPDRPIPQRPLPPRPLPQGPMAALTQPAVAVAGEPFGVLMVEMPVPPGLSEDQLRVWVSDTDGRVFYPATSVRTVEVKEPAPPLPSRLRPGGLIDRVRNAIRGEKSHRVPVAITIAALFRGSQTIELTVEGDVQGRLTLQPAAGPAGSDETSQPRAAIPPNHAALLAQWWRVYTQQIERARRIGDHPMLVHDYLGSMLASRLNFPWPIVSGDSDDAKKANNKRLVEPLGTLALLSGIEPLRDEILQQTLTPPPTDTAANLPLPTALSWSPTLLPPVPAEIKVEPLATVVPAECFYLRFGSFSNYLWFQDLSARNGGDLAQIILVRGFNYETSRRMERMLNTRMTAVAKMFGDQIISDMAIIGRDLYMKEGASLGVLFATKNRSLLMSSLDSERKQAIGKVPGATLQTIKINDEDVSFLSTPDNSVRSFLVSSGDHVLLTTSRYLAERFLAVAKGQPSLGSLDEFRWARQWMPESNSYSVFAYFSPEFFHGLVEPAYQVELRRRLEAIARIELAEVASRAAVAEGVEPTIDSMVTAGLLPTWFDQRADGGRTLKSGDKWIDSLRGARGSFLPIVDVPIEQISAGEAQRLERLTSFYQTQWQQMDPMLVGLRRFKGAGDELSERIGLEAYVAPFAKDKYQWVGNMLAPAAPVAIATPQDDVASIQLLMNGTAPLTQPRLPYHLFAGVKDMVPPDPGDVKGLIKTFRALKATPGYLGAYPQPGYLDQLPFVFGGGRPDAFGISGSLIGLYRWQEAGFSVLSFNRLILESVRGAVAPVQTEDPAQVRMMIRNLEGSRLSGWINDQWYDRAWRASHGNVALLDTMIQQLKVSGPEALKAAETVLDVKLNCPLGGQFSFEPTSKANAAASQSDRGQWMSSAWPASTPGSPPADYVAPWIRWFRGAQLHLTQFPDRLAVVGTIDVQRQPLPPETAAASEAVTLPSMNFDLFGLPLKLFGSGDKPAEKDKPQKKQF